MSIKSRICQLVTRLIIRASAWVLHRQIESLYRRPNRLKQHPRIKREMLANQHQRELAELDKHTRRLEGEKHKINARGEVSA